MVDPQSSLRDIDFDDNQLHDQLPAVEEYKAQLVSDQSPLSSTRQVINKSLLVVTGIVLVVIGWAIGRVTSPNAAVSTSSKSGTGTGPSSIPPPADVGTAPPNRLDEVIAYVQANKLSDMTDLLDEKNPQWQAAKWIADQDPAHLDLTATVYSLAVVYYALGGDRWTHSLNWMKAANYNSTPCDWYDFWPSQDTSIPVRVGVDCASQSFIKRLFLPSIGANGQIPPEIGLLTTMDEIIVEGNHIIDQLPRDILKLTSLTSLVLRDDSMQGTIPSWISGLQNLKVLDLSFNQLWDSIPASLGSLTYLVSLNLAHNHLIGSISKLGGLTSLENLILSDNKFNGTLLDSTYKNWSSLTVLDLSNNLLSGRLPSRLFTVPSLQFLDLSDNRLTGSLPDLLATNLKMEYVDLSRNGLSGHITDVFYSMKALQHIDLARNSFGGYLPRSVEQLSSLRYLFVAFNPALEPAPIPPSYTNSTSLLYLSLQQTNRVNIIPTEVGAAKSLVLLDLNNNMLTGYIPSELGLVTSLKYLLLKQNNLTGSVPDALKSLRDLENAVFEDNHLEGSAVSFCESYGSRPTLTVTSDCGELICPCCRCCTIQDQCKSEVFYGSLDPLKNRLATLTHDSVSIPSHSGRQLIPD